MAQCVVLALKGLACRASPSRACLGSQKHNIFSMGPNLRYFACIMLAQAATLLRRWDRPSSQVVDVPHKILQEAHASFKKAALGRTVMCETRAGSIVEFDRSAAACQAVLSMPLERPIRGGTRVRTTRGEGTIIGVFAALLFAIDSVNGPAVCLLCCIRALASMCMCVGLCACVTFSRLCA